MYPALHLVVDAPLSYMSQMSQMTHIYVIEGEIERERERERERDGGREREEGAKDRYRNIQIEIGGFLYRNLKFYLKSAIHSSASYTLY